METRTEPSPLSRAIWQLARWGQEAEQREESQDADESREYEVEEEMVDETD